MNKFALIAQELIKNKGWEPQIITAYYPPSVAHGKTCRWLVNTVLRAMDFAGGAGSSRMINVGVDGDGYFKVRFDGLDKDIIQEDIKAQVETGTNIIRIKEAQTEEWDSQTLTIYYPPEGNSDIKRILNSVLWAMQYLGETGASRVISFFCDGDGYFRIRTDGLDEVDLPNFDKDPVSIGAK